MKISIQQCLLFASKRNPQAAVHENLPVLGLMPVKHLNRHGPRVLLAVSVLPLQEQPQPSFFLVRVAPRTSRRLQIAMRRSLPPFEITAMTCSSVNSKETLSLADEFSCWALGGNWEALRAMRFTSRTDSGGSQRSSFASSNSRRISSSLRPSPRSPAPCLKRPVLRWPSRSPCPKLFPVDCSLAIRASNQSGAGAIWKEPPSFHA